MKNEFSIKVVSKSLFSLCVFSLLLLGTTTQTFGQNTLVAEITGTPPDLDGWNNSGIDTANDEVVLTTSTTNQAGAIFYSEPYNLNECNRWRVEFDFRIEDGNGADGIAFWYLENPPTNFLIGGAMGMPNDGSGLKVVFDTYDNYGGQPGNNPNPEIQVYYGEGYEENFPEPDMLKAYFKGARYASYQHAEIIWDNGNIEVKVDGTTLLSDTPAPFDNVEDITAGYFGFSASTGALYDRHSIKNVKVYIDIVDLLTENLELTGCDDNGDGFMEYDLIAAQEQIAIADNNQFTYYSSMDDAENLNNPIPESELSSFSNDEAFENQSIYVRVENQSSCYDIAEIDLLVNTLPLLPDVWGTDMVFCDDFETTLVATPDNLNQLNGSIAYSWYRNGVEITQNQGNYIEVSEPGTYTVIVAHSDCEFSSEVTIEQVPEFSVSLGDYNTEVCDETEYELVPEIEGLEDVDTSEIEYTWNTGEATSSITVSESGTYHVTVSYKGCEEEAEVNINLVTLPEVDLGEDFEKCDSEEDIATITANVSNIEGNVEYWWYRDGGLIEGETGSSIEITEEGLYEVEVAEEGASDNCVGIDDVAVTYYANRNCIIPEGMSPNGDGTNDCLDLKFLNDDPGIITISIFNRHGIEVFSENNYVDSWCGQSEGQDVLPVGMYYYVITLENEPERTGYIYLNY